MGRHGRYPATTLPAKNGNIRCATVTYTGNSRPKVPILIAANISRALPVCRNTA